METLLNEVLNLNTYVQSQPEDFPYLKSPYRVIIINSLEDQVGGKKTVDSHFQVHQVVNIDITRIF